MHTNVHTHTLTDTLTHALTHLLAPLTNTRIHTHSLTHTHRPLSDSAPLQKPQELRRKDIPALFPSSPDAGQVSRVIP